MIISKCLIILMLMIFMVPVYQGQSLIPKYYIQRTAGTNTYRVYSPKELIIPKYIVKPDPMGGWEVFPAGKPMFLAFRIKKDEQPRKRALEGQNGAYFKRSRLR